MISQLFAVDCKVESKMHELGLPLEQEGYTTTTDQCTALAEISTLILN